MLFFLRKIRKKLMQKNKLTTYLLYAVGEIVLVVIGILIAVSINNWNQRRILEAEQKVLLEEVSKAISFDSLLVERTMGWIEETFDVHQQLFEVHSNGLRIDSVTNIEIIRRGIPFTPLTDDNYPDLASRVLDTKLKKSVREYFRIMDTWEFSVENYNIFMEEHMRPFLRDEMLLNFGHNVSADVDLIKTDRLVEKLGEESFQQMLVEGVIKTNNLKVFYPFFMTRRDSLKIEIQRVLAD